MGSAAATCNNIACQVEARSSQSCTQRVPTLQCSPIHTTTSVMVLTNCDQWTACCSCTEHARQDETLAIAHRN